MANALKRSREFSLKLSQKGLILVCLPLAFELAFVIVLSFLLHEAEAEAAREAHSRAIVAQVNSVNLLFQGAVSCVAGHYFAAKDENFRQRFGQIYRQLPAELAKLKEMVGDDLGDKEDLRRVLIVGKQAMSILAELNDMLSGGKDLVTGIYGRSVNSRFGAIFAEFSSDLGGIAARHSQRADARPSVVKRLRVQQAIGVAVAFNVLLAIGLALYFNRGTANRLKVVADNALKLQERRQLNAPLSGSDEIAEVDHVFHQMANAITEQEQAMREIERMKQEFVAMVTHDLKTPLTSIQFVIGMLADGVFGTISAEGRRTLERTEGDVDRLIRLINDLLDIERLAGGKLELHKSEIPLSRVLERAQAAVMGFAMRSEVVLAGTSVDVQLNADEDRLVQVLVNLLSNAVKFSPPGSQVEVLASKVGDWAEVRVVDRGRGIPADHVGLIFERFKQVEVADTTSKGGTGLGLSISKAIVESHGGQIGVESEYGKGSTFWFKIPA